jgi:hypothetical protein
MQEDLLQYIWKLQYLAHGQLRTTGGKSIHVIKPGTLNRDAGPDFFNARIKIDNTMWAGNVEIHIRSSDWFRHKHDTDPAYNNVILHVVYEHDRDVFNLQTGSPIPVLELKHSISPQLLDKFRELQFNSTWISCQHHIKNVPGIIVNNWLENVMIERIEQKSTPIRMQLAQSKNNLRECFYIQLATSFGFNINNKPFEQLAKGLPLSTLLKHSNNLLQLEALLLGRAGFLSYGRFHDVYPAKLVKEFRILKTKYNLKPMEIHQWKFMKTRPSNFPTIRISQLANLIHRSGQHFTSLPNIRNYQEAIELLRCQPSSYWQTHYVFDKPAGRIKKHVMGLKSIENILINTVIPFIYAWGKEINNHHLLQHAVSLLEKIPPENNRITRKWEQYEVENNDAGRSQALIHLKKHYCNPKKCLQCRIGSHIIKP